MTSPSTLAATHPQVSPGEIAVGVVIGRTSEYFDFFVFGIACALVFPSQFFPFLPKLEATLWSYAIFSLAFIARPFGTLISMSIQRRFSREIKLTAALFLLGTCTAAMSFLPGYGSLGPAAIVLLALLRVGQGLALGGSWDGLPSLLALHAPPKRRGWYAMIGQLGAPLGFSLAAALFAFLVGELSSEDFLDWGWRYPFFVAFAVNVVALFARLQFVTTETFSGLLTQRELDPVRLGDMPRAQVLNIVIGAFAALSSFALFHLVTVFPLSWITLFTQVPVADFLGVQLLGGLLAAAAMLVSGVLSDRLGRRNLLGSLAIAIAVFSGYAPMLLSGGTSGAYAFVLLGFTLLGLSYAQAAGAVTSNFEPRMRYIGAALTADLSWLIGAAFAPLVALGLSAHFGLWALGIYLLSGGVCTLAVLHINRAMMARD